MRSQLLISTALLLFASVTFGQPVEQDKVFPLTRVDPQQDLQEVAMLIRSMVGIKEISADSTRGAISLRATPPKIALAEWLLNELTQPPNEAKREYRPSASSDDVVRVFFLKHAEQVRDLNEVAVVIRNIGAIPRLFLYNPPRALAISATEEQIVGQFESSAY